MTESQNSRMKKEQVADGYFPSKKCLLCPSAFCENKKKNYKLM